MIGGNRSFSSSGINRLFFLLILESNGYQLR